MSWVGVPTRGEGEGREKGKGVRGRDVTGEKAITMQRETARDRERREGRGRKGRRL